MKETRLKKISLTKEVKSALILSLIAIFLFGGIMMFSSNDNEENVVINNIEEREEEVKEEVKEEEKLLKPFKINAKVERYFFDINDSLDKQENAILEYNGRYTPSTSMEYTYNNNKFDVIASFSGTITDKKLDPLYGYLLYIKNDNGLTAIYGSLNNVTLNVGDTVNQGDIIGKASTNNIDSTLGNHLHFALMKENELVNPNTYYGKNLSNIY